MRVRAFITHKDAEHYSDCQDRFAIENGAIAVSDGMGATWMQKIWAELLVEKYVKDHDWSPNHESIKPLCRDWLTQVKLRIKKQKESGIDESVIYRNERRLFDGDSAGATFIGVRFLGNLWKGVVLGDSCLIEWNDREKVSVFHTSQDVEVFDNHPDYFDSSINKRGKGVPKEISGIVNEDNPLLLLVSDPLSDFLMRKKKVDCLEEYLCKIKAVKKHKEFDELVKDWRDEGMHNDDTTLIIVEYDGNEALRSVHQDDLNEFIEKEKESLLEANVLKAKHPKTNKSKRSKANGRKK